MVAWVLFWFETGAKQDWHVHACARMKGTKQTCTRGIKLAGAFAMYSILRSATAESAAAASQVPGCRAEPVERSL